MNREEAVAFLTSLPRTAGAPTLSRMCGLLDRLGNPQEGPRVIHLAGTNGKGSTAMMIAKMLEATGAKVGLFISPYIHRFEERIQLNGTPIDGERLAELCTRLLPYCEGLVSFEAVTAIGFLYFKEEKCDWVVLETGLGGRYDATNTVLNPELSVLTRIDLDHTQLLGDTIEQITREKCGIIRPQGRVVVAPDQPQEALSIILETCEEMEAKAFFAQPVSIVSEGMGMLRLEKDGVLYQPAMSAHYQAENAATALTVAEILKIPVKERQEGLKKAVQPGRFEWVRKKPYLVLDGAHNPNGIAALCESLRRVCEPSQVTAILGMLPDKERAAVLPQLASVCKRMVIVPVHNARGDDGRAFLEEAKGYLPHVSYNASVREAVLQALSKAEPNEVVCVCGSLYLLGEV